MLIKAFIDEYFDFTYQILLYVITDGSETQWGHKDLKASVARAWNSDEPGQRYLRMSNANIVFSIPMISTPGPDNMLERDLKTMAGKDIFSGVYRLPRKTYLLIVLFS